MESMEKSQFNSSIEDTQSFDIYEAHNPNANIIPLKHSTFIKKPASPEYSVPQNNNKMNLSFRNEGYKDMSSGPGSEAPSMSTVMTEEIPIIHHPGGVGSPHDDDTLSPNSDSQYFNSDTLPLRNLDRSDEALAFKRELGNEDKVYGSSNYGGQPKLSFLMELRSRMPDQPHVGAVPTTTFGQRNNVAGSIHIQLASTRGYARVAILFQVTNYKYLMHLTSKSVQILWRNLITNIATKNSI